MKKVLLLFFLMTILLSACAETAEIVPNNKLPDDYSLEDAKLDNCVVFEDLDITSGESVWESFMRGTKDGKSSYVRLAFYYTLNDPSHYSKDYYKEIKNDYPLLYIMDLSYDGERYDLYYTEDGKEYSYEYNYLVQYKGNPRSESAIFSEYIYYVLVNDNSVTWDEIEYGMISSQSGTRIDHHIVYSNLKFL